MQIAQVLCLALAVTSCVVESAGDDDPKGGASSRGGASTGANSNTGGNAGEGAGDGGTTSGGRTTDSSEGGTTLGRGGSLNPGGATGDESGGTTTRPPPLSQAGTSSQADPCGDVPQEGRCIDQRSYEICAVPTGNAEPTVLERSCRAVERCVDGNTGARCELLPSSCVPGGSECTGGSNARQCSQEGTWMEATCPGGGSCFQTALGAFCEPTFKTTTYEGNLTYEAFAPENDLSEWSAQPQSIPAENVLALSWHGEELIDATLIDEEGNYSLRVPSALDETDRITFFLMHPDSTGGSIEYAVFNPKLPNGEVEVPPSSLSGQFWQFAINPAEIPSGTSVEIKEDDGSGAVHIYNYIGLARAFTQSMYGSAPGSVVAHFRPNTEFSCGACFLPLAVDFGSMSFDSQLFFSATAQDRAYWADPVTVHEIGHYTMWAFGKLPGEGGPHCLGVPALPGIAWSEGWATGFSSIALDSPLYYDKQQGSMFWIDLERRRYSARRPWTRPDPQYGLIQLMDENDVAAMLWQLAADERVGAELVLSSLTHPRITQSPFKRGYTRHVWEVDEQCLPADLSDTGESAPMFADFLDALRCAGAPAAAIDDVTEPETAYPYPSSSPICK
ncbi:MAG TPA: hypothetical protein VFQ61_02805 [Polyangiaceae bacterium]|nr:hypothetical protein [Polyangiaceae bacterium]